MDDPHARLLVDFFQLKGLETLKWEDRQEEWYADWIAYQAKHKIYASLLSPKQYSSLGFQFDIQKLTRFLEVSTYFAPAHIYSLHVSFLGLFPILMSGNEALKQEAVAKLEQGGLFAFGVSEKTHGADLFGNEFTVTPEEAGQWLAQGSKYYIGNANSACIISVLAKNGQTDAPGTAKRAPFIFFALRPQETASFQNLQKIRTMGIRNAYVGSFDVKDHNLPESDLLSQGRDAWDAVFGTVIFGKFFLGFGSIGICQHAFVEAYAHMRGRILYGKPVTEMPHNRSTAAFAFARLTAMKCFAYRALDYLQAAGKDDRRYLLFTAIQKAKVSIEGVKVMTMLSECIGAKGFESDTYFEMAFRDAHLIPGLEGSTHINFGLTARFLEPYFHSNSDIAAPSSLLLGQASSAENPYWIEGRNRNPKTVRFAPYLTSYEALASIPNVQLLVEQANAFHRFVTAGHTGLSEAKSEGGNTEPTDNGLTIAVGKCFATLVYGQLVAESCQLEKGFPSDAMIALLFHTIVEDLSSEALKLAALFPFDSPQRSLLQQVVRVPQTTTAEIESVALLIAERYRKN